MHHIFWELLIYTANMLLSHDPPAHQDHKASHFFFFMHMPAYTLIIRWRSLWWQVSKSWVWKKTTTTPTTTPNMICLRESVAANQHKCRLCTLKSMMIKWFQISAFWMTATQTHFLRLDCNASCNYRRVRWCTKVFILYSESCSVIQRPRRNVKNIKMICNVGTWSCKNIAPSLNLWHK